MSDYGHRFDSWIQWAAIVALILGALWNLSGRLSSIEQSLRDDGDYHLEQSQRMDRLETSVREWIVRDSNNHVAH